MLSSLLLLAGAVAAYPSHSFPAEDVHRVGRDLHVPHRVRQVVSNDDGSDFDVLHHLSGDSPYFNSPGVGLTAEVPTGCSVTRAAYLVRHSDIYANDFEYENSIAPFLYKLGNFSDRSLFTADPSTAFLANWTSPITDPATQIEKVTDLGKQDAAALGAIVAQRHAAILNATADGFKIWAAAASRDQDTSKAFAQGFNQSFANVSLVVVDEGETQSANTLTPHESCEAFDAAGGSDELATFIGVYAPPVAARLNALAPTFNWTSDDVFAAQSLCGYDTVIRNAASGFCALFGEAEWEAFEYANDLMYHRSLGYGNALAPVLGMPWVSASTRLIAGTANTTAANSSAGTQNLWISFTHREEPPFIVTALGLFNTSNASMPTTSINYERAWKTSEILPFLANVALERLECANATGAAVYVRTLVNSATIPIPGCASGPDASCPLADFEAFVEAREGLYGAFNEACGTNASVANATDVLGLYEGVLPAEGAAVQVVSVALNGSAEVVGTHDHAASASERVRGGRVVVGLAVVMAGVALVL